MNLFIKIPRSRDMSGQTILILESRDNKDFQQINTDFNVSQNNNNNNNMGHKRLKDLSHLWFLKTIFY